MILVIEDIWPEFLKIINIEAGTRIVETWFKTISLIQWDNSTKIVYLKAPNSFVKEWVRSKYMNLIKTHLSRLFNENNINVIITEELIPEISKEFRPKFGSLMLSHKKDITNIEAKSIKTNSSQEINTQYTFDNFIVGPSNSLAYSAAKAIVEKKGTLYNPLFIYGDSGLGKTHLLNAIANYARINIPKLKILYQTADKFVQDFINAIRFNKVVSFESKYKETDILLIDDIQFLSNKEQTQEAFFNIFNSLYESKKQLVFSSDSLPKDITGLADRLKTRLDGGLIADIQIPMFETKVAIIKQKAILHKENLTDEVSNYIASCVTSDIRQLEGFVIRICAYASLTKSPITIELARKALENRTQYQSQKPELTLQKIALKVASYYNLSLVDLRSSKRARELTLARHLAMYLMKKHTETSLLEIANFLHRKDHTTVIYALEKITSHRKIDKLFNTEVLKIESNFSSIRQIQH